MGSWSIADPVAALATAGGKRALGRLVRGPEPEGAAALAVLLAQPPVEPKRVAFFLAWAGRLALGARPTEPCDRPAIRALLDAHHAQLAAYLGHHDRAVRTAATLPLAACRDHAAAVQRTFAACVPNHDEVAAALRIASAVLARDAGVSGALGPYPVRPGDSVYYADVIARQLDGGRASSVELVAAQWIGERRLSKLPWFPERYESIVRALIASRPLGERETHARDLVARGPVARFAVELVFVHRATLPRQTRAERLVATTYIRHDTLTAGQREVVAAPQEYGPGLGGSTRWLEYRIPSSELGRAILLGTDTGPLATTVTTARGPTPLFVALVDVVAEASIDKWSPARHRAAIDALVATLDVDRAVVDRAAHACAELVDPNGLAGLLETVGTPAWPSSESPR
jgi:hypothetical protein